MKRTRAFKIWPVSVLLVALVSVISWMPCQASAALEAPQIQSLRLENSHFQVKVQVLSGNGYAALEIHESGSGDAGTWKTMICGELDGRAAGVTFRLPQQAAGTRVMARVRTGPGSEIPQAVLSDPALFVVDYGETAEVPWTTKKAFLDASGPKMVEWKNLAREDRHSRLIEWALAQPGVAAAGAAPGANNVYVEYADGDISVLLDPRRTAGEEQLDLNSPAPPIEAGRALEPQQAAAEQAAAGVVPAPLPKSADAPQQTTLPFPVGNPIPASVPDSDRAITAFSLESTFPNSAPTAAGWLNRSGYQCTQFNNTTAASISQWSLGAPIGVLYWQAHGVTWEKKKSNILSAGLVTGELMTDDLENGAYADMRKAGELFTAKDGDKPATYFMTTRFIKKYLQFAPHSLVVVDACYGGNDDLGATFLEAGAGAYVSWDWESGPMSGTPCLQLFDRLLGTNEEPPLSTPKERSFSFPMVQHWMKSRKFDIDPSPKFPNQGRENARFVWKTHSTAPAYILKPSIMRVLTQFSGHEGNFTAFLIEGDFGKDPGSAQRTVSWGGKPMHVLSWDQTDGIVIQSPMPGPGGDLEVTLKSKFHSNLMPFSRWTVPFTYTARSQGSLTYKVEMNAHFYGDVHGSRGAPEQPVQYLIKPFGSHAGSTGQVTASGSYSPDPDTTIVWSGGTALQSADTQSLTGVEVDQFWYQGMFNIGQGRLENLSLASTGRFLETVDGVSKMVAAPVHGLTFPPPEVLMIPQTAAIVGNTITLSGDGGSATLSWPTVLPVGAPHDLTVR